MPPRASHAPVPALPPPFRAARGSVPAHRVTVTASADAAMPVSGHVAPVVDVARPSRVLSVPPPLPNAKQAERGTRASATPATSVAVQDTQLVPSLSATGAIAARPTDATIVEPPGAAWSLSEAAVLPADTRSAAAMPLPVAQPPAMLLPVAQLPEMPLPAPQLAVRAAPAAVPRRWTPYVLAAILILTTAVLGYYGWSFYKLSLDERPDHPAFRTLRPSGVVGNGYGFVAALLVVMNLSYLVRRRLSRMRLGSMRIWLDVHVFTGLLACVLASFHSTFQLRTPIASMTTLSLFVVVATGLFGRYLHMILPEQPSKRISDAAQRLQFWWPSAANVAQQIQVQHPAPQLPPTASFVASVRGLWRARAVAAARARALAGYQVVHADAAFSHQTAQLRRALAAEARSGAVLAVIRTWRGLHRFFALAMLVAVVLHAGVAWYYGYRWIFA